MRPPILCKLKTGLLIDADDHRGFVDTFNWLVDFCNNLCGEGDLDSTKSIRLDRHIDDRPVIRGGGGAGGGGAGGNFAYNPEDHTIATGYVIIARTPTVVSGVTVSSTGLVYLDVSMSSGSYSASIVSGAGSLPSPSDTHTYIPLYEIGSEFEVVADYRGAPHVQVYE